MDFPDFIKFAQAFGTSNATCDLNGDGTVDFRDFVTFARFFGQPVQAEVVDLDQVILTGYLIETQLPSFINIMFQVTDPDGRGVASLSTEDFEVLEDDRAVSPTESAMRITKGDKMPYHLKTVLLLDNSASVGGNLSTIKAAALELVKNIAPQQSIAVYQFSEAPVLVQDFTEDPTLLTDAINSISLGFATTNLYGSIKTALSRWTDKYSTSKVEQGFLVVLTDGSDTQGSSTFNQALGARGNKKVFTVGLGNEIEPDVLQQLGNAGFFHISDVGDLADRFRKIQSNIALASESFYWLNYMSPKRGNNVHTLALRLQNTQNPSTIEGSFRSTGFTSVLPGVYVNTTGQKPLGIDSATLTPGETMLLSAVTLVGGSSPQYSWRSQHGTVVTVEPDPSDASVARLTAVSAYDRSAEIVIEDTANGFTKTFLVNVRAGTFFELAGGDSVEMVWIEPGTFTMGSPVSEPGRKEDEGPQHQVRISQGFYMGKYEVTQAQWKAVMNTRPWSGESRVQENPEHPAVYINWAGIQTFVQKLNEVAGDSLYRLPTEAEWEYACRAGTTTMWSFGDDENEMGEHAWYKGNAYDVDEEYGHPVGLKRPNSWSLYDMHGNVSEWMQDLSRTYTADAQVNPVGPASSPTGVWRGGSFLREAADTRSARRYRGSKSADVGYIGFRLVRFQQGEANTVWGRVAQFGAGVAGLTVSLSGDADVTTTTDASGAYRFSNLSDGTYTVTVSGPDYDFIPESREVTLSGKGVTGRDFVAVNAPVISLPGGVTMKMIGIAPGTFEMGASSTDKNAGDDELPQHTVVLTRGLSLGKYEVTQGQWEAVMNTRPWEDQPRAFSNADWPAVYISWDDAQAFVHKLNEAAGDSLYRLPTEAEWEYACRAGTETKWSFGDEEALLKEYGWYLDNVGNFGNTTAKRVGIRKPNFWGLYDMHGNVSEWVQDWYGPYEGGVQTDPTGPESGPGRVIRGGNYRAGYSALRSSVRLQWVSRRVSDDGGFRLLKREQGEANTIWGQVRGIGREGVTVTLSGDASLTAVTDANGAYRFENLPNGSYTVTPSKTELGFSPASETVQLFGKGIAARDFRAVIPTYSVSGQVTVEGEGLPGVEVVALSNGVSILAATDSTGTYVLSLTNGTYTLVPSIGEVKFSPDSLEITVSGAAQSGLNFSVAAYGISGQVTEEGVGIPGVQLMLNGSTIATTDENGNYRLPVLTDGAYTVVPSKASYAFTPASRSVTVEGADVSGQDFAGVITYVISGQVTFEGTGMSGVAVTLGGAAADTVETDGSGNYRFEGLESGTYTVAVPSSNGLAFTPKSRSVTVDGADVGTQDFVGLALRTISGQVTFEGAGFEGVTLKIEGLYTSTAVTDGAGKYSIRAPLGDHILVPSKLGYVFTPDRFSVTISGQNLTGRNFVAESPEVSFADANLEKVVRAALGKPAESPLLLLDVVKVKKLEIRSPNEVSSLEGIENLLGLEDVKFYSGQISDLSPLANLPELRKLDLGTNQVRDLSPLANMKQLRWLTLNSNPI
ncbi:MAG: SUMF1/EgtB/PvdO family nonheme iron enzyme, partial [bacterium]|nr:SUMF1/EgtB/PvdO family nonheme iron enzyme [bacterium]